MTAARLVIDGGGSGSRARLHRPDGPLTVHGKALSLTNLRLGDVYERVEELLGQLGSIAPSQVDAGVAGGGDRGRADRLAAWLREQLQTQAVAVGRDVDLVLSHLQDAGAALVLGTGAIIVARGSDGEVVVDGHGVLVGDRGGGAWIALEALRDSLRALDLDGHPPALLTAIAGALNVRSPQEVRAAVFVDGCLDVAKLATLARVVLNHDDDELTGHVIERALDELEAGLAAALMRAGVPAPPDLVATGGLLEAPALTRRLDERLRHRVGAGMRRVDPLDGRLARKAEPA